LYSAGAKFLAGSNAATYGIMPGSGLHLELTLLHRIGLSPREALAAATSNYADVYGWRDVGRIEPGRAADLLLFMKRALSNVPTAVCGKAQQESRCPRYWIDGEIEIRLFYQYRGLCRPWTRNVEKIGRRFHR
jgi:imidazolonepropionase-like amidohydrolase